MPGTEAELVHAQVKVLDWEDINKDETLPKVLEILKESLGANGTGIVAIRGVPDFVQSKQIFLPMAYDLAALPSDYVKASLEDPESLYNAGWSHGKEKMGDKPDLAKGSFYYNPVTDCPGTAEDRSQYPASYPKNLWPTEKLPEFKKAACNIGSILKLATIALSRHVDALAASEVESYPESFLYKHMVETEKVKCRLLYYFPLASENDKSPSEDSWIGWHNDSGFFTALAGDMYVDHTTGQAVKCPDTRAGLYVVHNNGEVQKVTIPDDCLAIQMGECVQIVTGGVVTATPHCVRGPSSDSAPNIARISLPCFVDTPPSFPLYPPPRATRKQVLGAGNNSRVPPLDFRWTEGQTFGDFLQKTFSTYYDWSKK